MRVGEGVTRVVEDSRRAVRALRCVVEGARLRVRVMIRVRE